MRTLTIAAALALYLPAVGAAQRLRPTFVPAPQPTFSVASAEQRQADSALSPEMAAVVLLQPASLFLQQGSCDDSRVHGRADAASRHGTSGWFLGGVGSGLVLGLIGTGIITAAGASSNPQPRELPAGYDQACYREGYSSKAKSKNTISALTGGLVGTAAFVLIYVSATSN